MQKLASQRKTGRYVYAFADGDGQDKRLPGGKGANLCQMTQIGINVPPSFVITTEACLDYLERPEELLAIAASTSPWSAVR